MEITPYIAYTEINRYIYGLFVYIWHIIVLIELFFEETAMLLDRFDKAILDQLQRDGRISNVQLAAQVNLSESACLRRVRVLEQSGLIERYVALLDQKEAGLTGTIFVHIVLGREEQSDLAAFEAAVQNIPEVMECYLMTGNSTTSYASSFPTWLTSNAYTTVL